MHEKKAKIVSLVPSWTETLLAAGAELVGRTQFCIHPAEKIRGIPAVGGTKNLKIDEIVALRPDFVILDKEENKREMADALLAHQIEILVSHVTDIRSAADFLELAAHKLACPELASFAARYRRVLSVKLSKEKFLEGVLLDQNSAPDFSAFDYVIWKNPFMVIGHGTFISAVFKLFDLHLNRAEKYPKLSPEELRAAYCLFSTEPYAFAKDFDRLTAEGFKGALVDGEKISWYGLRNLTFLESCSV